MRSALVALFPDRERIAERVGPPVGVALVIAAAVPLITIAIVEAAKVPPRETSPSPGVAGETQLPLQAIDRKLDVAGLTSGQLV